MAESPAACTVAPGDQRAIVRLTDRRAQRLDLRIVKAQHPFENEPSDALTRDIPYTGTR